MAMAMAMAIIAKAINPVRTPMTTSKNREFEY
jgi:hypothetical protein